MNSADNTSFRIKPPRLLADSATEDMAGNVYAANLQKGKTNALNTMGQNAGHGFSYSNKDRMFAGQQEAQGAAEGAQGAASIRADDQQFNEGQRNANQMLQEQARIFDKNQMSDLNSINFERMFARQQGNQNIALARQRAAMNFRLALMSQGLA